MIKKLILGTLAVFVIWSAIDFLIHVVILGPSYLETANLWRPMEEMKMGILHLAGFVSATAFTAIYTYLISAKCLKTSALYGVLIGIAFGVSMGYGTYSVMPIPYLMALTWFIGMIVEGLLGGLALGLIIKAEK
ncbi:conserved hypothetical protein, membrane [Beggiatoa sp. PS]|nr:conserved hypothetical protein, membrane [Beggiatoa sp. PS]